MILEKIGNHTLLNDDTNVGLKYLIDKKTKVDYILTSPPYNAFRTDFYKGSNKINDSKDNDEYKEWLVSHFLEYDKILKKNGVIIYNINYMSSLKNNASNLFRVITEIEDKSNFVLIEQICWKKRNGTPSREARLTRVWENVFIFIRKSDWKSFHQKYKNILVGKPNYIEAPNNDFANDINKACFSSSMVEQLLTLYGANENSLVLENFMGTGTTAIGCEKIGCSSIGIELDKATFDFSKERIKEYIGDFGALKEENIFNIELL